MVMTMGWRQRVARAVWALALVMVIGACASTREAAVPDARRDDALRVMSFNIRYGTARDDGATRGEYTAILYDARRLEAVDSGTFWLADTPDIPGVIAWGARLPRICTWATLRVRGNGRMFRVFCTHLDHESEEARIRGAELVVRRAKEADPPLPTLIAGDFNAGEASRPVTRVREAGFRDTFRDVETQPDDVATYHGIEGRRDGRISITSSLRRSSPRARRRSTTATTAVATRRTITP